MDKEFLTLISMLFECIIIGFVAGVIVERYSIQKEKEARRNMKRTKKKAKEDKEKARQQEVVDLLKVYQLKNE
jgi:large-conductance mechanosensitive channel